MINAFNTAIACSGKLNGADRASANLKYYANEYHKANDESLHERRPRIVELIDCQSHNVFHIEDPCRTILSKTRVSDMFLAASWLRDSSNFLSVLIAAPGVIRARFTPLRGEPPPGTVMLMAELRAWMERHFLEYSKCLDRDPDDNEGKAHKNARTRYRQAWDNMLRWRNGKMTPHSLEVWFPEGMDIDAERSCVSIAEAYKNCVFKQLPGKPEAGKWTKLGPALDWWMCYLMTGACDFVPESRQATVIRNGAATSLEEQSFRALQGLRHKAFQRMSIVEPNLRDIVCTQLALEGQRYLVVFSWERRAEGPGSARAIASLSSSTRSALQSGLCSSIWQTCCSVTRDNWFSCSGSVRCSRTLTRWLPTSLPSLRSCTAP